MWFKALRVYQARTDDQWPLDSLRSALEEKRFQHCSGQEAHRYGWVSVLPGQDILAHEQARHYLMRLRIEERLLPTAVLKEQVHEKVEQIETEEGRKVSRKEQKTLLEDLRAELLPRAFTRSKYIWVWLDNETQRVIVDTSSEKQAELALNALRESLGSFPVVPMATQQSPATLMTQWIEQAAPADLTPQESCELRDGEDEQAVIRCRGQDLASDEIRQHLEAGKRVTQLALDWQDQIQFTLTDQWVMKGLTFADALQEEASDANPDQDPMTALDTEFMLMSRTLAPLITRLVSLLGGPAGRSAT